MPDAPPPFRMPGTKSYEETRKNSYQRGYTPGWNKSSDRFRKQHQLCEWCLSLGFVERSAHTDHIIPHHDNKELFNDPENRQALCKKCHTKKTLAEARWIIAFVWEPQREYITALNEAIGRPYRILKMGETIEDVS